MLVITWVYRGKTSTTHKIFCRQIRVEMEVKMNKSLLLDLLQAITNIVILADIIIRSKH